MVAVGGIDVGEEGREDVRRLFLQVAVDLSLQLSIFFLGLLCGQYQIGHHLHPNVETGPERSLIVFITSDHLGEHAYDISIQGTGQYFAVLFLSADYFEDV